MNPMSATMACLLVASALGAGCTRERSRAVEPVEETSEPRDYRGMIERARTRQNDTQLMADLEAGIARFQTSVARLPTNLQELVIFGFMTGIPDPPPGMAFSYDPVHGNVRLLTVPVEGVPQLPTDFTNETRAKLIDVALPPPQ